MVFGPINRRNAIGQIATTTAALGFAPIRALAQAPNPGPGPMMTELSAYMGAARMRALPEEVTEQAKYHLLDTIAAMISGSELPPGQAAQRYIREHGGNGATTVVGVALTAAPIDAALANGVMAHSDETDDSHNEFALPSGLRGGAGGARGGRSVRHRRHRLAARRDARLRHRHACGDGDGRRGLQL